MDARATNIANIENRTEPPVQELKQESEIKQESELNKKEGIIAGDFSTNS